MLIGKYRYIWNIIFIYLMFIETNTADKLDYGAEMSPLQSKFSFPNSMLYSKVYLEI